MSMTGGVKTGEALPAPGGGAGASMIRTPRESPSSSLLWLCACPDRNMPAINVAPSRASLDPSHLAEHDI
jgi:hypothetical protein